MNTEPPRPDKSGKQEASNEGQTAQLLREGIAASKLGDRETARGRFQQVVSLDPDSEQGWFWLASVVESAEERKACLEKVVAINPGNLRAKKMLEQLARPALRITQTLPKAEASAESDETAPTGSDSLLSSLRDPLADMEMAAAAEALENQIQSADQPEQKRRRLYSILLIAGAAVVVLAVIGALVLSSNVVPAPPTPANLVLDLTGTAAKTPTRTRTATSPPQAVGTGAATESGPAATVVTQTLAPTFTALPSSTKSGVLTGTPMAAPPPGLPGHLIAVSGGYIGANDINLSLFQIDPADWKLRQLLPGERGEYAVLLPDGKRLLYSRLVSGLNTQQLRMINLDGTQGSDANSLWGNKPPLADQRMVSVARNGLGMVFAAANIVEGDNSPDIYFTRVNFSVSKSEPTETGSPAATPERPTARPGRTLTRTPDTALTPTHAVTVTLEPRQASRVTLKDSGYHSWPSLSPDGKTVVFADDSNATGLEGTHIYSVPVEGGTPKDLTSTMDALAETEPEWSPDGTQIVFRSVPRNSPPDTISNLYVMKADGSGKRPLVNDIYNNIRPHWSPDGKYVAFSSTRNGKWEIYLVEVASGTIYQVTQTDKVTLCTAWGS